MVKKINGILFMLCAIMVLTAQVKRPDNKAREHAPGAKPIHAGARPATAVHSAAVRSIVARPVGRPVSAVKAIRPAPTARKTKARAVVRPQAIHTVTPNVQHHAVRPFYPQSAGPRIYAVAAPAKAAHNNRLFHRRHHGNWQPRYNFYSSQYHFYPYVNIASTVELSGNGFVVAFDGQNYYYDQGTFYVQDQAGQYVAVPPPLGIIVNPIAPQARPINVNGQIYYRYKGVFYLQTAQGYQVVGPVQ